MLFNMQRFYDVGHRMIWKGAIVACFKILLQYFLKKLKKLKNRQILFRIASASHNLRNTTQILFRIASFSHDLNRMLLKYGSGALLHIMHKFY